MRGVRRVRSFAVLLLATFVLPTLFGFKFPEKKTSAEFIRELQEDIKRVTSSIEVVEEQIRKNRKAALRPDLLLKLAELHVEKSRFRYFLAREQNPEGVKKVLNAPDAVHEKEQAIHVYQRIVREHPNYINNDKVIFFMAQEYAQIGQDKEERRQYGKLIRHYPRSEFRDDVLLILGDKEFDNRRINTAAKYYRRVLRGREGPLQNLARYKLAWCRLNQKQCGKAMALFESVAKSRLSSGQEAQKGKSTIDDLQREALMDSVLCYTEVRKGKEAARFYRKLSDSNNTYVAVLDKLANRFYIQKQIKEAVPLYRELIRRSNDTERQVEYLRRLFGNLRLINYSGPIDEDAKVLIDTLRRYLHSWRVTKEERLEAAKQLEIYLRDAATRLQLMARQRKSKKLHRRAAATYEHYLKAFANTAKGFQMKVNYADALYAGADYLKAAETYLELAERSSRKKKADEWVHSAVVSYFEALKKPDALKKVELIQARYGFLRSGNLFLERYPRSPRAPDIQYTIARIHYDENDWDRAIPQLTRFVFNYPRDKKAVKAGRLLLDAYNMKDDMQGMVAAGKQLLARGGIRDRRFLSEVRDVVSKAEFKQVEESLDEGEAVNASAAFFRISKEYEGTEVGEKALYNAFVTAKQTAQPLIMIRSAERLRKKYPRSRYRDEILPALGQALMQAGQFEMGVQRFEEFARTYPRSDLVPDLLLTAGKVRTAMGHYKSAIRDFRRLLSRKNLARRDEVLRAMIKAADESRQWKILASTARALRSADPSSADALVYLVKAQLRQGKITAARKTIKQARVRFKRIASTADRAELEAELMYWEADITRRQYAAVRIRRKGKGEDKVVERKGKMLERLEAQYTKVAEVGSGPWTIAAMAQVGHAYNGFAKFLGTTSVPKGLHPKQARQYRELIKANINEMRRTANDLFKTCREKSHEFRLYTHEALECARRKDLADPGIPKWGKLTRGDTRKLRSLINRLMNDPQDVAALNDMARLYLKRKRFSHALLLLSRSAELAPTNAETHNLMGVAFRRLGRPQDAFISYQNALAQNPRLATAKANLTALCMEHQDRRCAKDAASRLDKGRLKRAPDVDLAPGTTQAVKL